MRELNIGDRVTYHRGHKIWTEEMEGRTGTITRLTHGSAYVDWDNPPLSYQQLNFAVLTPNLQPLRPTPSSHRIWPKP